ncbi:hypothetical protein [Streptomyces sp. NPDC005078]|uniref:hypothetical protein n=1 Tax=unclassified Streptomyces TaxID=2593676 RepID=UPI0033B8F346
MSVSPVDALDHSASRASGADEQGMRLHAHDAGLLLLRLALGLPMASHGAQKL